MTKAVSPRSLHHHLNEWLRASGGFAFVFANAFSEAAHLLLGPRQYLALTVEQLYALGVASLPLVCVTGIATGSVMALQFGYGLQRFGGTAYIPQLVALSVTRELGPMLTSLLLAGRVGSGMASELASMSVTQQLDAVRALGTSPYSTLAFPRILACLFVFPVLTLCADFLSIAAAMVVCRQEFSMNYQLYVNKTIRILTYTDLFTGVGKTVIFGLFVALAACWRGLNTTGGTKGVGFATTWVVVVSSAMILIGDLVLSKIFVLLGWLR